MTLELACGFEGTDGAAVAERFDRFTSGAVVGTASTRWSGGRGLDTTNGEHGVGFKVPTSATKVFGFSFQPQAIQALQRSLAGFVYRNEYQVDVVFQDSGSGTGKVVFYRGSAGTGFGGTLIATLTTPFTWASTWHTVAFRVLIHPTAGTIEVALDDVIVETFTGLNTQGSSAGVGIDEVRTHGGLAKQGGANSNWHVYYDDIYVDSADFLGVVRMAPKLPTANGNYTQWTPSSGTDHAALVDEIPENTTDYNSSATVNHIDALTYGAVGVTGTVLGVQLSPIAARASGDGYREVAPFARLAGTDLVGPALAVPDSAYWCERYRGILPLAPDGAAWTITKVDNAEFGYKLVT